jgi:hypothetical protein
MRHLITTLFLLATAPTYAAPVTFSPNRDGGTGSVVVAGDTADFTKPDAFSLQARFGDGYTLENEGDSLVLSGILEVKGSPENTNWRLRWAMLAAPPQAQGNTGWLGYVTLLPYISNWGYIMRREGSGPANDSYVARPSATTLAIEQKHPMKYPMFAGKFDFKLTLTKVNTGLKYHLRVFTGVTPIIEFEGVDTNPSTLRFDRAGFYVSCSKADSVKLSAVDVTFQKADQPKDTTTDTPADTENKSLTPILIAVGAGVALLVAAATAVIVIRRRRSATPAVVVRPPPPPPRIPPPPGA